MASLATSRHHASQPAVAQAFLEAGQDRLFRPGFGIDHPVRMQSGLGHGRREQIPPA